MTDNQQREAARQFFYKWQGRGKEDEDARSYWIDVLQDLFGVEHVTDRVEFEKKVTSPIGSTNRIDVYIPETRVLIEQKSLGIPLDKPQARHGGKTPYEQAKEYDNYLPYDERARWIITSNFVEIWIYDMNARKPEPLKLQLSDLQTKYPLLEFLVKKNVKKVTDEMRLSIQAGELVGKIHDRFLEQYNDPLAKHTQRSLNMPLIHRASSHASRLLFLQSGIFLKMPALYMQHGIHLSLISLLFLPFKQAFCPPDMLVLQPLSRGCLHQKSRHTGYFEAAFPAIVEDNCLTRMLFQKGEHCSTPVAISGVRGDFNIMLRKTVQEISQICPWVFLPEPEICVFPSGCQDHPGSDLVNETGKQDNLIFIQPPKSFGGQVLGAFVVQDAVYVKEQPRVHVPHLPFP